MRRVCDHARLKLPWVKVSIEGLTMILTVEQLFELRDDAVKCGLDRKRHVLLLGLEPDFVSALAEVKERREQVLLDLQAVNEEIEYIERWLRNALHELSPRPAHKQRFEVWLARINDAATVSTDIPRAPQFYAEPHYIPSNQFVGRRAQLDSLNDWAAPSDQNPVLLFEAIGGMGKSMLTWEWTKRHAPAVRANWAGVVWYSFYERGAVMGDFCQRALAYMTGAPLEKFRGRKTEELATLLLNQLRQKPWLLVLDGFERVLVAYHRVDAPVLLDEAANKPTDDIGTRHPCVAIRPEDDELIKGLTTAAPSKILITSRLTPRVLVNNAGAPIPGVIRILLRGLRPADAEGMLNLLGITGSSAAIQDYLKRNCDCHPLVIGAVAGLIINDFIYSRGDFDAWVVSPEGGGRLNLSTLDLVQKRNHILEASINCLSSDSREVLSLLSLMPGAADYKALSALNPFSPREPDEVARPEDPRNYPDWNDESSSHRSYLLNRYDEACAERREYEQAYDCWRASPELASASRRLKDAVLDLDRRGLIQYDRQIRRYDLHPVVRAIAFSRLSTSETNAVGQSLVDYFTAQGHTSFNEATTLDEVRLQLHIIHTLLRMQRFEDASSAYLGVICNALDYNLEAFIEVLAIVRPFFPDGWSKLPETVDWHTSEHLAVHASHALIATGQHKLALDLGHAILKRALAQKDLDVMETALTSISTALASQDRLARIHRYVGYSLAIAECPRR